jgi:hypothetical protein
VSANEPGYSITENVFDYRAMARVCEALGRANVPRTRAGARHVLSVPAIRELASHPALVHLATTFIGARPIPFRATLFEKSQRSNWLVTWHQDTTLPVVRRVEDTSWGPWSTKGGVLHAAAPVAALETIVALRVHLDNSTHDNGPLRVLPGTHAHGVLSRADISRLVDTITPVDCVSSAGGVVAMHPLLVHSSSKARDAQPRRVLHIEYAATLTVGPGIELAAG